ncbi:MAG: glycogen/starch synthase [bacterium]
MFKPLSILFVTSEVIPFIKVGGIADVSYSLPLAVRDLGHDIRVMIPKYGCISERRNRIHEINRLRDIAIPIGKSSDTATVKSSSMNNPRTKVQAYITTNNKYFDSKKGIYENMNTGEPYPDNDERFMFFCRSVIETCLILSWFPDVIHCNDWQTALLPAYAKIMHPEEFKKTKFVFTIHNFHEQGEFPAISFSKTGLPEKVKKDFIHKKNMNFVKGALAFADYVTTVSPGYAKEITSDTQYTNGLSAILSKMKNFKGILNGIDPWYWNPTKDKLLKKKYSNDFWDFKETNKSFVLKKFNLEEKENVPLIAMITRLDDQKGIPLVIEAAESFLKDDVQFVLLGEGNPGLKQKLTSLAKKYNDKFAVSFGYNEELAHRIEAGADIYLLPSQHEPCGLNALYSLAYGALPIVRETGGLKDIVTDINEEKLTGNGFIFKNYKSADLLKAINRAIRLYSRKEDWEKIAVNNISQDYSWKKRVAEYDDIYSLITK